MKKFIPLIIAFVTTIIVGLVFWDTVTVILTDSNTLIVFVFTILLDFIFVSSIFYLVSYRQRRKIKKLNDRLSMWTDLSLYVNKIGDEVFNELPIGVIIYDKDKEIRWTNPHTLKIFDAKSLVDEDIENLNLQLYNLILENKSKGIVEINNEKYDVINRIDNNYLYLFNETERESIKHKYDEQIPSMGIIYFDNLDESLTSLDVSLQSSIKSEYLSAIDDWLTKYDGYLKLFNEDRIVFMVYRKDLEKMMISNFEILDKVREISTKNNIRVTLSIGIASWDVSYSNLGTYAQSAIDLAEKRGGDQAVVNIQNQKIEYFGAKNDASAKSSKVGARVNAETLKEYIKKASQVFVMGHDQTDLDSYGSMIATYHMAKSMNKDAYKVYDLEKIDQTATKVLNEIKLVDKDYVIFKDVLNGEKAIEKMTDDTLLIIVDTQSPKIVINKDVLNKAKNIVVIDHHRASDEGFNAVFSYIEPYASSTIELIMELISFFDGGNIKFTDLEASIMYGGLVLDTNNFTTRTGVRTFEVAYKLRELGADPGLVKSWLRKDIDRTLKINKLLSTATLYLDRFIFMVSETEESDRVILAQTSDEALQIEGVDAAFTIAKINGVTSVSARSTSSINVQLIMEHIGGGGHLNSAAAQVKNKEIHEVYKDIKDFLDMEYKEGEEMEIILLEDVKGRGNKDQVIKVASGYANFLIKQGKALIANEENLKALNDEIKAREDREKQQLELMLKLKKEIEDKSVTIEIQIGKDGKLFGSITTKSIAYEFEKQNGILLDKKKIELNSTINGAGIYSATVSLYKDVKANFEINVVEK